MVRPTLQRFGIRNTAAGLLPTSPSDTANLKRAFRYHRMWATTDFANFFAFASSRSCMSVRVTEVKSRFSNSGSTCTFTVCSDVYAVEAFQVRRQWGRYTSSRNRPKVYGTFGAPIL